jgi:hypothetical protein
LFCLTYIHSYVYIYVIINSKTMTNLIPASIEFRAAELMLKGMDPIEAVKQALIDEMNLIGSLVTSSNKVSKRGRIASEYLLNRYTK